jgi:hypothetical protein
MVKLGNSSLDVLYRHQHTKKGIYSKINMQVCRYFPVQFPNTIVHTPGVEYLLCNYRFFTRVEQKILFFFLFLILKSVQNNSLSFLRYVSA